MSDLGNNFLATAMANQEEEKKISQKEKIGLMSFLFQMRLHKHFI